LTNLNFAEMVLDGIINVALDNEQGLLLPSGQINNDAGRPFVNGPSGTVGVLAGLNFRNGFTNQGRIVLGPGSGSPGAGLVVTNGTLVNAPGASLEFITNPMGQGRHALSANLHNQGTFVTEGDTSIGNTSATFVNDGTIRIDGRLAISGGTFDNHGGIDGRGTLAFSGTTADFMGDLSNDGLTLVLQGATLNLTGTLTNLGTLDITGSTINAPLLVNRGVLTVGGPGGTAVIDGAFMNPAGATLTIQSALLLTQGFANEGAIDLTSALSQGSTTLTVRNGTLTNAPGGTIAAQAGGGVRLLNAALANHGTLAVAQDTTLSGSLTNRGTMEVTGGDLIVNEADPAATVVNTGTVTVASLQGFLLEGGDFANAGTVRVGPFGTVLVSGAYSQSDGLTLLDGSTLTASLVDLEGGVLTGAGVINGDVLNNAELEVGQPGAPGVLIIVGNYTQTSGGVLVVEIGGPNPGTDFDLPRPGPAGRRVPEGGAAGALATRRGLPRRPADAGACRPPAGAGVRGRSHVATESPGRGDAA
jgi:hypothetical protein